MVFSCPNCKTSLAAAAFISDGKCDLAPLKAKVQKLEMKEPGKHPQGGTRILRGRCVAWMIYIPVDKGPRQKAK